MTIVGKLMVVSLSFQHCLFVDLHTDSYEPSNMHDSEAACMTGAQKRGSKSAA